MTDKKLVGPRYCIPPDEGSFSPGTRLINWVWYCNIPADSPEMTEVLTDINGRTHSNTVASGLVRPEVWEKQLKSMVDQMARPFADLVSRTERPFVTKVNDALSEKASFYDGRVLLIGDALATFRPHFAMATEKAARQVLELGKVWEGGKTIEQWEREITAYEKGMFLASRVLGAFGCRGWLEFGREVGAYLAYMVRAKFGRV